MPPRISATPRASKAVAIFYLPTGSKHHKSNWESQAKSLKTRLVEKTISRATSFPCMRQEEDRSWKRGCSSSIIFLNLPCFCPSLLCSETNRFKSSRSGSNRENTSGFRRKIKFKSRGLDWTPVLGLPVVFFLVTPWCTRLAKDPTFKMI